jgi:hypothetical protein
MESSVVENVEHFARVIAPLTEPVLETEIDTPPDYPEKWLSYGEFPRSIAYSLYQELRELAVDISVSRATKPATTAQRILGQHQAAYRDLTGALVSISDAELDVAPAPDEWPLRTILEHMLRAEFGFSLVIQSALDQRGTNDLKPAQFGAEEAMERSQGMIRFTGGINDIRASFTEVHGHVLRSFVDLDDDDLGLPTLWWEGRVTPLRFRLQRFDAHLREHTIQIDKTILGIGHTITEGERLARLIHRALGECEAAVLGADNLAVERQGQVEELLTLWTKMVGDIA